MPDTEKLRECTPTLPLSPQKKNDNNPAVGLATQDYPIPPYKDVVSLQAKLLLTALLAKNETQCKQQGGFSKSQTYPVQTNQGGVTDVRLAQTLTIFRDFWVKIEQGSKQCGKFGRVKFVTSLNGNGTPSLIIKRSERLLPGDNKTSAMFQQEEMILWQLGRTAYIRVRATKRGGYKYELLTDRAPGQNLSELDKLSLRELLNISYLIAQAVTELHTAGVIHRDLKLANIMYCPESGILTFVDFGLSFSTTQENILKITTAGTPGYIPPEGFMPNNPKVFDYYSLGKTLAKLFGIDIYKDDNTCIEMMKEKLGLNAESAATCNTILENVIQIVRRLTNEDWRNRMSASESAKALSELYQEIVSKLKRKMPLSFLWTDDQPPLKKEADCEPQSMDLSSSL